MRRVLAALLLLPVLELAVAIVVGRRIGVLAVLAALVLIAVVGALLVQRKGATAWRSLNRSLRAGEPPTKELADATVLVLAGVLLIVPGFVTDVLALLLLFAPTRSLARRPLERMFLRAAADRVTLLGSFPAGAGRGGFWAGTYGPGGSAADPAGTPGGPAGPPPRFGGEVVEGEIIDDDPPTPPR